MNLVSRQELYKSKIVVKVAQLRRSCSLQHVLDCSIGFMSDDCVGHSKSSVSRWSLNLLQIMRYEREQTLSCIRWNFSPIVPSNVV